MRPQKNLDIMIGRKEYMSLDALDFRTQSRRDDFHSLIYTLINLRSGLHLNQTQKKTMCPLDLTIFGDLPNFEDVFNEIFSIRYD